jgi:hypothetical protein
MLAVDFSILNQKATPAIYADTLALRPAASFAGRLFVDTAAPYGIYRDTGAAWVQVASVGGGGSTGVNGLNGTTNIGLGGTLANNTNINGNKFDFNFFDVNNFLFRSINAGNTRSSEINITPLNLFLQSFNNGSSIYSKFYVEYNKQYSDFNGAFYGLSLDDTTGKFVLGDYGNDRKYNSFVVDDDNDRFYITTTWNQVNNAQDLFYVSNKPGIPERFVKLGDFNGYVHNMSLTIDDENYLISTTDTFGVNGLQVGAGYTNIGSFTGGFCYIGINQGAQTIQFFNSASTSNGLSIDFTSNIYKFGNFNGGLTYIEVNEGSTFINLQTDILKLTGTPLEDPTPGVVATKALLIELNGTQYKINLY